MVCSGSLGGTGSGGETSKRTLSSDWPFGFVGAKSSVEFSLRRLCKIQNGANPQTGQWVRSSKIVCGFFRERLHLGKFQNEAILRLARGSLLQPWCSARPGGICETKPNPSVTAGTPSRKTLGVT